MIKLFSHLDVELNHICQILALLGTHHILHVSRIRVNKQALKNSGGFINILFNDYTFYAVKATGYN